MPRLRALHVQRSARTSGRARCLGVLDMKSAKLSPEQLAMHLQIIAHATHVQLDMATRLLGGEPDAVLEVLEIIMGVHLMAARMDRDEIATTLDTYAGNVVSLTDLLR